MYYSWKFNWLVFNMYQYIILLSCIYMYKVRCTCDGLHIWKLTVKPLCAAHTSCKWLTPISNHQSKTKTKKKQIYSLQLEPLINKHIRWATVATFLDDNFGVFHCFYPPVSNHFVFIPTFTVCTSLLKICEELVLPTTKLHFSKDSLLQWKGPIILLLQGRKGGGGDFIKKILETVHISEKKNLA